MLKKNTQMNSVIVIGNSPKIERFLTEASLSPEAVYKVIGVVQVGTDNAGRRISGIPILGSIDELNAILYKLSQAGNKPTRIIVDLQPEIKVLLPIISSIAQDFMVPVSRFGEASEISHNLNSSDTLRPIALEDLLARPQRCLDYAKISRMIHGKTILITGAGGSIGSEIVVQCCKYGADKVLLMDSSEFLLYEIEQLCKRKYPGVLALPRLLDIRDYEEVEKLFMQHKPHIVFHAAALKHVPLMEEHKMQALSVNVLGTFNMLEIAQKYKIQNFVFISTDKAVSPLSFMGITKRIAEILCYCLANQSMPVNIVRFGNVLGSNGSVVPLFEKQIVAGGPVTVTHPETTRYFMTIPEAVSLVLQASTNDPAKLCNTYILDMGQPIKILELAEKMIALSGLRPYVDVPIEFTGLRPGEKLHESLCVYGDDLKTTECESIFATTGEYCGDLNIALQLEQLRQAIVNKDESLGVQLSLSIIKSEKFK
jgi:O-antigen biosynthesis protein WbqV